MKIVDFIEKLSNVIPFDSGFEDDRLGLQIQTTDREIQRVLVAYEVTSEVVDEAKMYNVDAIVSFHPLIYFPLEKITNDARVGVLVSKLIRKGISLVVCHTNFDAYRGGTSWLFAEKLGLVNLEFLVPNRLKEGFGFGVVGEFEKPLEENEILERVQDITFSPLRWCRGKSEKIRKVALVGGSGMGFVRNAYEVGADAFITADIKYHSFHEYDGKMMLIDPGHWEMEYLVPFGLKNLLDSIFKQELIFFVSNIYTNPVRYFVKENFNEKQKMLIVNREGGR